MRIGRRDLHMVGQDRGEPVAALVLEIGAVHPMLCRAFHGGISLQVESTNSRASASVKIAGTGVLKSLTQ
jgi:hypothetical protein